MPVSVKLPEKPTQAEVVVPPGKDEDRTIKYVTFFGDSAIPEDHPVYKDIFELAKTLAQRGYGVVNGGGPGVMKAATSGAKSVGGNTIAIYWEPKLASHFEGKNFTNVTDSSESYSNYMVRTLGLIEKGHVFIACQGGTGTVSEFGMVWALAKMYFGKHKPVILYGEFWRPVVEAFSENMLIDDEEKGVLYFAQTPQEVANLLDLFEAEIKSRKRRFHIEGDEDAFVINPRARATSDSYSQVAKDYHRERAGKLVSQDQLDEFLSMLPSEQGLVLDIGTGPGYDLSYLGKKHKVHGMDPVQEFVDIAQFENPDAQIIRSDIVNAELDNGVYDGVWSRDAFHHIPDQDQKAAFEKVARSLKPNGIFYLIVQEGEGEEVKVEKRADYELKRFYHYYTEQELKDLADKVGLEMVKVDRVTRSHQWLIGVFKKPEAQA